MRAKGNNPPSLPLNIPHQLPGLRFIGSPQQHLIGPLMDHCPGKIFHPLKRVAGQIPVGCARIK